MNPYAKILSLLEALPDEERLLVSMARRQKVGERECGCLFGTLLPKGGFALNPQQEASASFRHETDIPETPIAQWGHAVLGLDDHTLYRVVNKLELANDYYEVGKNDPETCRARYRSVCARLRLLSADYEEDNTRSST
jgi:hypothetical protein